MNPGCTPAWIGFGHSPDKIADLTIDCWSSGTFGFEFPEKLKTLAVPVDNGIRLYNDKRFLAMRFEVILNFDHKTKQDFQAFSS